ncbi:hypothetical protein [Sinorhizobium meliloti]|uniref:hypothetical protein n=1 Tax=Rhizobium meliloti TaxID=382 RepID=UPI00191278DC|nr:hypothetical protein [Sinorhizobium meliloti]
MSTEFNDSQHYGFFMTGTTLTSSTGKYIRQSELVLAGLRAQGVFDNMTDGTTPPGITSLWLDKNSDPAVLKEWDPTGSAWVPVTFARLFGRAIVTAMAIPTGTGNAVVVAQPTPFIPNRMYSLTPIADNTGAATIQVTGVGTYAVKYTDGSDIAAQELKTGNPTILLFTGTRFEILFALADIYQIRDQVVAIAAQFPAISANTMLVDNAAGTARETKTFEQVRALIQPYSANTMLVDNAAGNARENKSFSQVRALLDAVTTQEFGADSVGRSATQRFGDVVDLDDFGLDGSGNTSTVAANDAALAKLVSYMNGAGSGKTFRSRKGRIYCFSAAFTFPAVRTRLEGATFRYIGNTISSGDLIHFNGTDFDNLDCHLPTGSFRVRPIKVSGCRGDHIGLKSDTQLNNYNASNIDWAIRLYGRNSLEQENRIGEIFIDGFNKTILVLGDSFAKADPQRGGYVGYVSMKNYEKGLTVRNVDGMSFRGGFVRGMSSSAAVGEPGCNGVLLASAKNCFFKDFLIEDAPEHGWRCAGDDLGNEVESFNNHISDITIKRARQCGFKIWVGNLTYKMQGGTVQNITVEDAIWGNPNTTGFNYSAFLLQNFHNMNFSNLQASAVDQAYSGREAFFIGAGGRSTLSGLRSYNGGRVNGIRFSEFNNGESDTVNNLAAQNQVKVEGFYSEGHTGAGVFIDHPTQAVRDVVVTSGNIIGGTHGFDGSAAAARFAQPCVFQARVRGNSGSFSNLPASVNISTINLGTSVA